MTSSPASPTSPAAGWSDERVERLVSLWADPDRSAGDIARALGVTRNAVLGKVHRLGLSNRGRLAGAVRRRRQRPETPRASRPPGRAAVTARAAAATLPRAPDPEPLSGLAPRLETLGPHACRWPIGDPRAPDFAFCGRPAPSDPYCPVHRQAAFRKTATKARRRSGAVGG